MYQPFPLSGVLIQQRTNTMDKLELKEIILRHAQEAYRNNLQAQRTSQQNIANDAIEAENDSVELSDESNKLEELEVVEEMADITDAQQGELENLEALIPAVHWEVMNGSVVVTNVRNFFVGASIPSFEVFGVEYVGISSEAPIFQALHGKAAGEVLDFRGTHYEIKEIF